MAARSSLLGLVVATVLAVAPVTASAEDAFDRFGDPGLTRPTPPLLRSSLTRPLSDLCEVLGELLPDSGTELGVGDACTFSNPLFFVMVRSAGADSSTVRFKLNAVAGEEETGLAELLALVRAFHDRLNWPMPEDLAVTIMTGSTLFCRVGGLDYQFFRERGPVPRFNAILRLAPPAAGNSARFTPTVRLCR